jgi:molybdopterin molybdotransferase
MLSIEQALSRILAHVPANATERLPIQSAFGRILAEPVVTQTHLPPWDNSAMDGYAVRSEDVPGKLRVLETVAAGAVPTLTVEPGTATRIMTGAPLPLGADSIVMVEDTETEGDHVRILVSARKGQHIRRCGSDVTAGTEVLSVGKILTPGAIGLCAAVGVPNVRVSVRPRVAILSTGDEIVESGRPLSPGQIWSSNPRALGALVEQAGAVPVDLGNVRDDPAALEAAFREALRCDVVVSTGGVSVGDFDFVKEVMAGLGVEMDFWKVWMKPGKPLAFGTLGSRPVFGLPGNPVSCMVNFLQFVRPVLRKMMGDPRPFLPVLRAEMRKSARRKPDRPELIRVRLQHDGEQLWAEVVGHQGSGNLAAMAEAHGFVLVDPEATEVAGRVWVQVFDTSFLGSEAPSYPWADAVPAHDDHHC